MADTITLIQGSETLDLDDGTAYETKAIELTTPAPDALMHMPDYGENRVVRTEDKDRQAILRLRVPGASWDAVFNSIAEIRRWLKEAARAEIDGDTDTVYLQLQRGTGSSTATNATNHRIRFGWIEGDSSVFTKWGQKAGAEQAIEIFVSLILTPYGDAASTITLSNDMFSSPHMVEDSDADGLADGWTELGANTTFAIDADQWLIGGQSQRIECTNDAEAQGILCDTVTAAAADEVVEYIWITGTVTADVVYIQLRDGASTNVTEVEFDPSNPAGYDKIITEPSGGTKIWYRYVVSDDGTGPRGAANVSLWVTRKVGDASAASSWYRIDGAYIEVDGSNGTTAPDAWMSARNIDNRNDIESTNQASKNRLNYVDTWGIPGDAPALVQWALGLDSATDTEAMVVGSRSDGRGPAASIDHWLEDDDWDSGVLSNWNVHVDAARTRGESYRLGLPQAVDQDFVTLNSTELFRTPFRVFAAWMCDDTDVVFRFGFGLGDGLNAVIGEWTDGHSVTDVDTWEFIDMGLINLVGVVPEAWYDTLNATIRVDTTAQGAGSYLEFDFVYLVPTQQLLSHGYGADHGLPRFIDGFNREMDITLGGNAILVEPHLGSLWELSSGQRSTRTTFFFYGDEGDTDYAQHNLTVDITAWLTVQPRTRHLIGTL